MTKNGNPNGQGNGNGHGHDTAVIDPTLKPEPPAGFILTNTPETARPQANVKVSRKRKRVVLGVMLTLFLFIGAFLYLVTHQAPKERVTARATERVGAGATQQPLGQASPDQQTANAIENLRKVLPPDEPTSPTPRTGATDLTTESKPAVPGDIRAGMHRNGVVATDSAPGSNSSSSSSGGVANERVADAQAVAALAGGTGTTATGTGSSQTTSTTTSALAAEVTSRPSPIKSIIFDESSLATSRAEMIPVSSTTSLLPATTTTTSSSSSATSAADADTASPVLPDFGAMLPVVTSGAILTIRANSFVRMETTYTVERDGWRIAKGTKMVGKVTGSGGRRAFVDLVGFIDPTTRKLVPLSGTVIGPDGGDGLLGKRHKLNPQRARVLRQMASNGVQILGALSSFGSRGGTVVIDQGTGRVVNPAASSIGQAIEQTGANGSGGGTYVEVKASTPAFIMVTALPATFKGISAEEAEALAANDALTEQELAELLLFGSPEEVERARPRMTDAQGDLADRYLADPRRKGVR